MTTTQGTPNPPESRTYVVGLPVVITVYPSEHPGGSDFIAINVDTSDLREEVVECDHEQSEEDARADAATVANFLAMIAVGAQGYAR